MFKFRLQRVLEMRERTERDAAAALAAAREDAERARRAADVLAAARAELAAGAAPARGTPVGALHTHAFLLDRLDERVAAAGAAVRAAEGNARTREDGLRTAFRDRRTLDRLRERDEGAWRAGAAAADRQLMDELALTRFAQGAARGTPQGAA